MPPAAAIFDNDGLALDTEPAWTRAQEALFARYGVAFTLEHKRALLGSSAAAGAPKLEAMLDRPGRGTEIVGELEQLMLAELRTGASPMPGLVELLEALRAAGVPIGLASNSSRPLVDSALAGGGLEGAFDVTVSADEVQRPKPAPDLYLAAAAALGASPRACVALEDSPTGLAAARAAGLRVVGVPSIVGVELDADVVAGSLADGAVWEALGLTVPVP
jgi:HAD superfamily hydrolase (TIGR01509 family)